MVSVFAAGLFGKSEIEVGTRVALVSAIAVFIVVHADFFVDCCCCCYCDCYGY